MVGTRNTSTSRGAPLPPDVDPTGIFEIIIQRMEQMTQNSTNRSSHHQYRAPPPPGDKVFERFKALRPEWFDRVREPWIAEQWLRDIKLIFEAMNCTEFD